MGAEAEDAARFRFIRDHVAQMHSPDMSGQHCWRWNPGWLGQWIIGPTFTDAIDCARMSFDEEDRIYWND